MLQALKWFAIGAGGFVLAWTAGVAGLFAWALLRNRLQPDGIVAYSLSLNPRRLAMYALAAGALSALTALALR